MSKSIEVTYTVRYTAQIEVEDTTTVADALEALEIPETKDSQYIPGSYEVEQVKEQGKNVPRSQW
jgi:sulfur carrier protein ThiS